MMGRRDVTLFLVSLFSERTVNYPISQDVWLDILSRARDNGWRPKGTILDFDFQYNYATSAFEELDEDMKNRMADDIESRCRDWPGGYATGEFQLVTEDDAAVLVRALETVDVPRDLRNFLMLGAFRIGG